MRTVLLTIVSLAFSVPLLALEAGRADGKLTVNGTPIPLTYAYAIRHQKNQITNRNEDTKIVLTDKPLADGTDLNTFDANFPDGVLGLVVCVDGTGEITHVVVQHPNGMYDAGYFTKLAQYRYKPRRAENGAMAGTVLVTKPIATATIQFSFDVNFAAAAR